MAGGGCRLLPFLCRGDPVAIAANLERHHPRRGNDDPFRPRCRGRSGEGSSGCPRYHRARLSPLAHPGRPRTDDAGHPPDDGPGRVSLAAHTTESGSAAPAKERCDATGKGGLPSHTAGNPRAALNDGCSGFAIAARRSSASSRAQRPTGREPGVGTADREGQAAPQRRREGGAKAPGGEGKLQRRTQGPAQESTEGHTQGPTEGCPALGLQQ